MKEQWKPIRGYTGYYEVSNLGRVKGLERKDSLGRRVKARMLNPVISSRGYPSVFLCKNGDQKQETVHKLVMRAFVGPPPKGKEIDHIDNNRKNAKLDNLEYVFHRENTKRGKISDLNGNKTSTFTGVSWSKQLEKWCVYKSFNSKTYNLGSYSNEEDASAVYEEIKSERQAIAHIAKIIDANRRRCYSKITGVSYYKNSGYWYYRPKGVMMGLFKTKKEAEKFAKEHQNGAV